MSDSFKRAKLTSARTSGYAVSMGGAGGQGDNAVTLITNTSLLDQGHILGEAGRRSMLRVQAELEAMRAQWLQLINDKIAAIKVVDAATTLARDDERCALPEQALQLHRQFRQSELGHQAHAALAARIHRDSLRRETQPHGAPLA